MNFAIVEHGENTRSLKFGDKEVSINRVDPYGLWEFSWDVGEPPAKLRGSFTTLHMAFEFLENYVQTLEKKKTK